MTLVIVEDDQPIREMMKSVLEVEGYEVVAAANGKEGLEMIRDVRQPCMVLLDMMMPVKNGWDFLDVLRTDPSLSKTPVVVVSAYGEIARSVRPDAYVSKPIQLKALLTAIQECAA